MLEAYTPIDIKVLIQVFHFYLRSLHFLTPSPPLDIGYQPSKAWCLCTTESSRSLPSNTTLWVVRRSSVAGACPTPSTVHNSGDPANPMIHTFPLPTTPPYTTPCPAHPRFPASWGVNLSRRSLAVMRGVLVGWRPPWEALHHDFPPRGAPYPEDYSQGWPCPRGLSPRCSEGLFDHGYW